MKIYLIRHGQTAWNLEGRIQGVTDIPLNEKGLLQAKALMEGMKNRPVTKVFTSNLSRAYETGRQTAEDQNVPIVKIEDLKEVCFGIWEGLTMDEIAEQYPEELREWNENPVAVGPPQGESQEQVALRARKVLKEILAQSEGDIAIVSHGTTVAFLLKVMLENTEHAGEEIIVENSSITTLSFNPEKKSFELLSLNDVSHMAALPKDEMPKII